MNILDKLKTKEPKPRIIVRLSTSYWHDARGAYQTKRITYLKRKSYGYNALKEELADIGAYDTIKEIKNFDECKDGIYELKPEYETDHFGYVDALEFRLVPYDK